MSIPSNSPCAEPLVAGQALSRSTGKERDSETGLDYFGARYYGSTMGRWLSPDWALSPEPVPYADLSDPQTLNLYGYVRNNPLSHADADGHCIPWCTAAAGAAAGALGSIIVQKVQNPDGDINWKQVGAAAVGGAVAGATMGVMAAPAAVTTLTGTTILSTAGVGEIAAAGATAGIAGGVAERAVENNGDPENTIGTPGQIATDAGLGATGALVGHAVGSLVPKLTGAHETAKNAAAQSAKHPALSGSALARRTAASAAAAARTVASQEAAGEVAGHAAVEGTGQAAKKKDKD